MNPFERTSDARRKTTQVRHDQSGNSGSTMNGQGDLATEAEIYPMSEPFWAG